jgi:tRNA C32,U32 (ribose-2'-O)-methylase TrmJ
VPVPAGELDPLVAEWMESLEITSYFRGHEPILVEGTLRRVLQRMEPDAAEVTILRGMLRKMRWRMKNPG